MKTFITNILATGFLLGVFSSLPAEEGRMADPWKGSPVVSAATGSETPWEYDCI